MDLMKLMAVVLAGWINRQQKKGRWAAASGLGGLLRYYYRDAA